MLKAQDIVILLKILANPDKRFTQRDLSGALRISLAEVNGSLKRLVESGLLRKPKSSIYIPILAAVEEFLIHSVKYLFPGKLGALIRGVPTAVGSSLFEGKIVRGKDPLPVWPDVHGTQRGLALMPIHVSILKSSPQEQDQHFYEYLVLIDTIRSGNVRERNMAIQLLKEKIGKNEDTP